jgi:hypothetical protein
MGFDDCATIHEHDNSLVFIAGKLFRCLLAQGGGIPFHPFNCLTKVGRFQRQSPCTAATFV